MFICKIHIPSLWNRIPFTEKKLHPPILLEKKFPAINKRYRYALYKHEIKSPNTKKLQKLKNIHSNFDIRTIFNTFQALYEKEYQKEFLQKVWEDYVLTNMGVKPQHKAFIEKLQLLGHIVGLKFNYEELLPKDGKLSPPVLTPVVTPNRDRFISIIKNCHKSTLKIEHPKPEYFELENLAKLVEEEYELAKIGDEFAKYFMYYIYHPLKKNLPKFSTIITDSRLNEIYARNTNWISSNKKKYKVLTYDIPSIEVL